MEDKLKKLQVEDGNFTRIVNPLIEELIKIPFKGCELAVALFIIRKTYGFNKLEDEISLSQFTAGLSRSKQTIINALKNLQLVKVARLVKRGNSKKQSNCWQINKYYNTWELVKVARLVKSKRGTSLMEAPQLVKTARHTKDNTKNNTKDILSANADEWDFNNYLKDLLNNKRKDLSIIGNYWVIKGYQLPSWEATQSTLKKDLKVASALKGYSLEDLTNLMKWLEIQYQGGKIDYEWKLTTVQKKINDYLKETK